MANNFFKSASITPERVLAGDSVEISIKLVVGPGFVTGGSRIVLDTPAYLGTSRPTLHHQELSGAMEVFCSNPDIYYTKKVWNMEKETFSNEASSVSSAAARAYRIFVIDFEDGEAQEGDEIEIKWGYIPNGFSSGTKVTTLVLMKEFYNTVHVRYFKDGTKGLPDYGRSFKGYERPQPDEEIPLKFRVLPREPEQMRLIRRQHKASLLIQDRFFNVCDVDKADRRKYINENIDMDMNGFGVFETKDINVRISGISLPLSDAPGTTGIYNGYNVYFGDLHSHSAFSNDCIEREKQEMTPDMSFAFARDVACLDFFAVTDHHQPWDRERNKLGAGKWELLNEAVRKHNKEGEFLAFPGFEYRCERGDTIIVLNEYFSYDEIDDSGLKNIKALWEKFRGRNYISIPHFHNMGKLESGQWYACPYEGVEPNIEIFSCHGSYEVESVLERRIAEVKKFRPDRNGKYFLTNGYRYGYTCNSDGHKGNSGFNGLTAVYAKELTRDGIFEAIKKRRVFGTTNARIVLLFTMNGEIMGSVLPNTREKTVNISVNGENRLKAVDVFRNGELYRRFKPYEKNFKTEFTVTDGETANWYVRAVQLDNHIAYSSPIWFE